MRLSQVFAAFGALVLSIAILAAAAYGVSWYYQERIDPQTLMPVGPTPNDDGEPKDYYEENPFELVAKEQGGPRAEIPKRQFYFERMVLGDTGEYDFTILNTGDAPLKLAKGPTQCKCTVAGLKDQEIPPGGEAVIHLEWKPTEMGEFYQAAIIYTNDPDNSSIRFSARGTMYPEVVFVPASGWSLGTLALNSEVDLNGAVYSNALEDFEVLSVEASSDDITIEAVPMDEEEKKFRNASVGYALKGKLKTGDKGGSVNERITVRTNVESQSEIEFTVSGVVTGPAVLIGQNWYAGRRLLDLGTVDVAKGKSHKLTLMVDPAEEPMELIKAESIPPYVEVTLKAEQTGQELAKERYTLTFNVPPNSRKGYYSSDRPGKVILYTTHPEVAEIHINLQMLVE